MKNFFSAMIKCKTDIYINKDRASADAFLKLKKFVTDCEYTSCKRGKELVKLLLEGYKNQEIAEMWGISVETVRTIKRNISETLWKIFPADLFDKLVSYKSNKEYVDRCFFGARLWGMSCKDLILSDVVNKIRHADSNEDRVYSKEDVVDEIDFLRRYSVLFFNADLMSVDISKLKYVLDVINGSKGTINDRIDIISEFTKIAED